MASRSYRLPGVYSEETTGPFVSVASGGNAVVAIIGEAAGYVMASQRAEMSAFEEIQLNESGVIGGGVAITSRVNGAKYRNGIDFVESTVDGVTTVKRRVSSLSLAKTTVSNRQKTYYTAEPIFSIMVDTSGSGIEGYPICGTVRVLDHTDGDSALVEGVDYEIDYFEGTLGAVDGGKLASADSNAHVLYISFEWTTAEPVTMTGESAFSFEHDYIAEGGLADGTSIRLVSCEYTDTEDAANYEWGSTPGADDGYLEGIDFVIDYQTGRITRTSTSRIPSFDPTLKNYLYAEFAYDAIRDGELVVITYPYQNDDYTYPQVVSSYTEAAQIYGSAWDSETGDIISPLSLGAYIAFQNGMPACYLCAVKANVIVSTDDDGSVDVDTSYASGAWEEAFNRLTTIEGIDIVVPLTSDRSAISFGMTHLVTMKTNQDERVMICGFDGTDSALPISTMIAQAQGYNNEDVWLVGPSTVRFRNPIRSTVEVLPGFYMAAAVAGYNASVPQYTPLTRKAVSGFYSANEYATKVNKTNACANGIMYVDEVNGQLRVLHGTSTNVQNVVKSETNVTLTKYYLIKRLRNMFEDGYIGEIITDSTLMSIQSVMFSALTSLRETNYIYSFSDLNVQVDEQIATQVNVTFTYVPTYGMNYIQISFAIDTSTGVTETELY